MSQHDIHTRGNALKLVKPRASNNLTAHQFKNRFIDAWNSLDSSVVTAPNINCFKSLLNCIDFSEFCIVELQ